MALTCQRGGRLHYRAGRTKVPRPVAEKGTIKIIRDGPLHSVDPVVKLVTLGGEGRCPICCQEFCLSILRGVERCVPLHIACIAISMQLLALLTDISADWDQLLSGSLLTQEHDLVCLVLETLISLDSQI